MMRKSARPLMSAVRTNLCKIVKENPGIHFRGLGRAASVTSAGQLRHNVDRLLRQGLIVEVSDGRYKRFFLAGEHDARLRPQIARFSRDVPRQIGEMLLEQPMNRAELRRSLGCSDSTLGYHLKRMTEMGDVRKERGRNCCHYSLANIETARQALQVRSASNLASLAVTTEALPVSTQEAIPNAIQRYSVPPSLALGDDNAVTDSVV